MRGSVVRVRHASVRGTTVVWGPPFWWDKPGESRPDYCDGGSTMSGTDRGTERRRLLEAVRSDDEAEHSIDEDAADRPGDRPEPAPDGGTVTIDGPLYHCTSCGRTYLEQPTDCAGCSGSSFDRRTGE